MRTRWLLSPELLKAAYVAIYVYAGRFFETGCSVHRNPLEILIVAGLAWFAAGEGVSPGW